MHELSVAENIVEIAEESALNAGCGRILQLTLEVGTQSGVVLEALQTAMESACMNTMLENAEVIYSEVQAMARCTNCQKEYPVEQLYDACVACGSIGNPLISGKELRVKSLDAE